MIDVYWSANSPFCWRVLLTLELKGLAWRSHPMQTDLQAHKAPQMLAMNPRGRLPVLRDGDYVCFESLAILYYLDRKYPEPPIFGRNPEEAAVIMRVVCEYQAYAEPSLMKIVEDLLGSKGAALSEETAETMHRVASEARTIERRMAQGDWVVGDAPSAADFVIYPDIRLLLRVLARPGARELAARFLPLEVNYPALAGWLRRLAQLPGHDATWPPHWGEPPAA